MNIANYNQLLQTAAEYAALDPENITVAEAVSLRRALSTSLRKIWESNLWPEVTPVEQRTYRPAWVVGTLYAAGDEVYWPQTNTYFQALRQCAAQQPTDSNNNINVAYWAPCLIVGFSGYAYDVSMGYYWTPILTTYTGDPWDSTVAYTPGTVVFYPSTGLSYACFATPPVGDPPIDTGYWGPLTPFNRSIALAQAGQTTIGDVHRVTIDDPHIAPYGESFEFFLRDDDLLVPFGPSKPWVEFTIQYPELTGDIFDATAIYSPGGQMAFTDGQLYDCLTTTAAGQSPITAPAKWSMVQIPARFTDYITHNAAALYLKRDEKWDAFRAEYGIAKEEFVRQVNRLVLQQQTRRLQVAVRT